MVIISCFPQCFQFIFPSMPNTKLTCAADGVCADESLNEKSVIFSRVRCTALLEFLCFFFHFAFSRFLSYRAFALIGFFHTFIMTVSSLSISCSNTGISQRRKRPLLSPIGCIHSLGWFSKVPLFEDFVRFWVGFIYHGLNLVDHSLKDIFVV